MKLKYLNFATNWKRVLEATRRTVGKDYIDKEPSDSFKKKILLAEHSPIRMLEVDFVWENIKQWITAHFVRHHVGVEKFVHTQRDDRRDLGVPRDELPQGAENDMMMTCNAQALINISRKRLCANAHKETREAWKLVVDEVKRQDPVLGSVLVPECIYRGFCPEIKSCGFCKTEAYQKQLKEYRNEI